MKYFISADEREKVGCEKFIEFRLPNDERELCGGQSLYIAESAIKETGFRDFWVQCMADDLVFDMDTISKTDLALMWAESIVSGNEVREILAELRSWAAPFLDAGNKYIEVIHVDNNEENPI